MQMSFWGATVITNMLSAIPYFGQDLVQWVWGGFAVDNATLNRFFSLHYLLPFVLAALAVVHLLALHEDGSNNPLGISSNSDKIAFHPYYTFKDAFGLILFFIFFSYFVFFAPNVLGHRMARVFWKIYDEMNYMRKIIVNRTIYCRIFLFQELLLRQSIGEPLIGSQLFSESIPRRIWELIRRLIWGLYSQVKIIFLDNNSQAKASETTRSNLKLEKNLTRNIGDLRKNAKNPFKGQYLLSNYSIKNFNQWLAGFIDADGYIYYNTKLNVISIEITVGTKDILALRAIKERFGGNISKRTGSESYRLRISSRSLVIKLLNSINGDLINPVRLKQFKQVCPILHITPRIPRLLSLDSAWISGFFDGDGTIILLNRPITAKNPIGCRGIQISFSQKEKDLLELLQNSIGGSLHWDQTGPNWKLSISSKLKILELYQYFKKFPSLTSKNNKLILIPEIYSLQYNKTISATDWENLKNKFYSIS